VEEVVPQEGFEPPTPSLRTIMVAAKTAALEVFSNAEKYTFMIRLQEIRLSS
jgi:hypothetical protein